MFMIVDNYMRECLVIEVDGLLCGEYVVVVLIWFVQYCLFFCYIKVDNGSEFILKMFDKWVYENGVEIDFLCFGKLIDNVKNELFNGCFWEECFNVYWFLLFEDVRCKIEVWCEYYNEVCFYFVLQWMILVEFVCQCIDWVDLVCFEELEFFN